MKFNYLFALLIGLLAQMSALSQMSISDSLEMLSYYDIEKNIKISKTDSIKRIYAEGYLKKAKIDNEIIEIANGYYFLSQANSHTQIGLKYADSIVTLTKSLKNEKYPAQGYLQKGIQLYYLARYSEALENYVLANTYFTKNNDVYHNVKVKHYIGLLKNAAHNDQEALKIFQKNLLFFEKEDNKIKFNNQYLKSLFALADSYNGNDKLDSSLVISSIGIKESFKSKDDLYPYFLISFGATKTLKEEYLIAIDSLIKGVKFIKNKKKSLCDSYLIISLAYEKTDNIDLAIKYLEKVDSIYEKEPQVIFQAKEANETKFRLYKTTNDYKEKIRIVDRLLHIDSILKLNYEDLGKQIVEQYEIPNLLSEKQRQILKLEQKSKTRKTIFSVLIFLFIVIAILSFFIFRKNVVYKKRFEYLLKEPNSKQEDASKEDLIDTKNVNSFDLSEDLVKTILNKLDNYEKNNKFLSKKITLNSLAKEFDTNSSYLSKVINYTKGVNFANYLNNLKIDYAINKLKVDKQFRSYTIKAIAEDVGFSNAQSFTNAFYRRTNLYPSYFIKKLNGIKNI